MNGSALRVLLALLLLLAFAVTSSAIVVITNHGDWPESWPAALDPLRTAARTIEVGTGIQEVIYEIPFKERAVFERSWPLLAGLGSKGGTLTLYPADGSEPERYRTILIKDRAAVRVFWPVNGGSDSLKCGPPWPESILSKDGVLPEYVMSHGSGSELTWISAGMGAGFRFRARVDLELVVDGSIVELSRIQIPDSLRLIDRR